MSSHFRRAVILSMGLWTAALWAVSSSLPAAEQRTDGARKDMSEYLPPGSGKVLVAKECSTCHDMAGVVRLRASKEKWEAVVLDMVARGAPLMIEDADAITTYLSEVFGPTAPPLVDVNTAGRDELVKLPGVSPALADRLVAHRDTHGSFPSRQDVRTVLGLDPTAFEKIQWFIRVEPPATAGR